MSESLYSNNDIEVTVKTLKYKDVEGTKTLQVANINGVNIIESSGCGLMAFGAFLMGFGGLTFMAGASGGGGSVYLAGGIASVFAGIWCFYLTQCPKKHRVTVDVGGLHEKTILSGATKADAEALQEALNQAFTSLRAQN